MPHNRSNKFSFFSNREAGVALVVVLWLLALMSFVATVYAVDSRNQAKAFFNETGNARARTVADAGIHLGIRELLREDSELGDDPPWLRDGSPYTKEFADTTLTISLYDESGKIDLNAASEPVLRELGQSLDLDTGEWGKIVDAILDWRDEDDLKRLNGAEDAAYEQAGLPYGAKNGFFQSIDEIQQVLGVDHSNYRKLASAITIYTGRDAINTEFAPRKAMLSLPGVLEQEVDALLATREANRYDVPRQTLPALNNVSKWLHSDTGPVYTVRSTARTSRGDAFTREAVIWLPEAGKRRYWILDWRAARTDKVNKTKDDPEFK